MSPACASSLISSMLMTAGVTITVMLGMKLHTSTRGLRVYPYPRIYPYPTRTRGSGTGRVNILRVRVGSGKQVTGTGIPEVYP